MAEARKAFEGELICYLISWIPNAILPDQPINPEQINPWKTYEKPKALIELEAWRKKRAWQLQHTPPKK